MSSAILKALLETFAPIDADERAIDGLRAAIGVIPAHRRGELTTFIGVLSAIGFARWPRGIREAFLRALGDAPIGALRTAFQALKRLTLFVAYTVTDAHERNALWPQLGYSGPRADRPEQVTSVPVILGASGVVRADAVVVGSGAGGGVAAALLTRAGLRTIVIEAGPPFDALAHAQLEAGATAELFLESGAAATTDLSISLLAGACVGGGTTVNWMTSLRMLPGVLAQWEAASGIPALGEELAAHYAAVEQRLGTTTTSAHNRNNAVIAEGCAKLGWDARLIPRNADGCGEGCGYCGFGCAYGNKRGTAMTYLRDAVAGGAQIYAKTPAQRVRIEGGRACGIDAGDLRVDAPLVVVAAGALRTPGLLARSGVASPHLGRHLKLHPVIPFVAEFDEPIEPWHGAIQTAVCAQFIDLENGYGAVIEACPAHPGSFAAAVPWRSRDEHAATMLRARNSATMIVLTRDRGEGEVSLDGRDDVRYVVAADDAARMFAVLTRGAEMAFAAGARRVHVPFTVPLEIDAREKLEEFAAQARARGFAPNRATFYSAHQMGTARMHADPEHGVVDGMGRVHGVEGLIVADASVFPLASGVNPMLTIMALAHRALQ